MMIMEPADLFGAEQCMYSAMRPGFRCPEPPTHTTPDSRYFWCVNHALPDEPMIVPGVPAPGQFRQAAGRGVRA